MTIPRTIKREIYIYPLEAFPPAFADELAAYGGRLANVDFDDDGPVRPARSTTVKTRLYQLRAAASALVHGGVDPATITSLAQLVEPERFKQILHFFLARAGGKSTSNVAQIATCLRNAARYGVKVDDARYAQLQRIARKVTIRKLRKHGVEVVSVTQPTGDDPSQTLMRQIIGIFDEYTSRENGKNVTRAMRESAKQGFWNGATPPLGYRIVEAERRGAKIKKRLDVDPVDAETVQLIFRLYAEGDGQSGPLGVKKVAEWLNAHGYRTRKGATFGVGPIHGILTNRCYASGKWPYGVKNSRTGQLHDPSSIIEIDVPTIVPLEQFERVQARLAVNHPKVTPPRVVNGPILLTGLAVCASCGAGMTRTGTRRRDKVYSYYSCAGYQQKGKTVCKGRHVPLSKLDGLVLDKVAECMLEPQRISATLEALIDRIDAKDAAVDERRARLEAELAEKKDRLARLYRAIEDGIVELDVDLKTRIATLKQERDIVQTTIDRLQAQAATKRRITPERIAAFSSLFREKLTHGDIHARRNYLRTVVARIEVGDDKIRIIGDRRDLAAAIAGPNAALGDVRPFVRKWRTRQEGERIIRRDPKPLS
jgi:hypothetical protein